MKTIAIIQARFDSSRLPGKVLAEIGGHPMLWHVVNRVRRAKSIETVRLATTTDASDDAIERWCYTNNVLCFRGHPTDVLDRYYRAAQVWQADPIVRITADCPLIDAAIIDQVVRLYRKTKDAVYASNVGPPATFPDGLDVEVFSANTLARAWLMATGKADREHVTTYIRERPERFPAVSLQNDRDLSGERWTVDTPEDLEFVRAIYRIRKHGFGMQEVLNALRRYPELRQIHAGHRRNEAYEAQRGRG